MKTLYITLFLLLSVYMNAQDAFQYFEGNQGSYSILIQKDSNSTWQIGKPHKIIFDEAASQPNAILTDTLLPYPESDTAVFQAHIANQFFYGIWAFQWSQKLNYGAGDGGMVEFKTQSDSTWSNAFTSPYVYNYYGYDSLNLDTLTNGELGFVGTDSTWKDIWFCLDASFYLEDTISLRYTHFADSIPDSTEGWMIDNMLAHITMIHTVGEEVQEEYLKVYPTPTSDILKIQTKKLDEFHVIESIQVRAVNGNIVLNHGKAPTKFELDVSGLEPGVYFVSITTNLSEEVFEIVKL